MVRFAVIIAAFQAADTLGETLDSLLAQDYAYWEAVVVDDGSTDDTLGIALRYAARDARIKALRQEHHGAGRARNAGVKATCAEWILGLDADDFLLPGALRRMAAFMEAHPDVDLFSFGADVLMPDGSRHPWTATTDILAPTAFNLEMMVEGNRMLSVVNPVRRSIFEAEGGFRDVYVEDYDLWLRLLASGVRHLHDPETLWVYRVVPQSKSADTVTAHRSTAQVLEDLAKRRSIVRAVRRSARRQARRFRALAARDLFERNVQSQEFKGSRILYCAARNAYPSRTKWLAALPLVLLSPRLLGAIRSRATRTRA